MNKRKVLFLLRSSKTHSKGTIPQSVKITSITHNADRVNFCLFQILRKYIDIQKPVQSENEAFFVFYDQTAIPATTIPNVLKKSLKNCGFKDHLYLTHSLRSGRARDLMKLGLSVETIKKLGRWKSDLVFRYLK